MCTLVAGNLSRTCTEAGWSDVYPTIVVACWSDNIDVPSEVRAPLCANLCDLGVKPAQLGSVWL